MNARYARYFVHRGRVRANSLQQEFVYAALGGDEITYIRNRAEDRTHTEKFLKGMEEYRRRANGYHPYLIAFVDSYLIGTHHENIFGDDRPEKGLAVFTSCRVPGLVIPQDRMLAYFMYYLAKPTLCFLAPEKEDHTDMEESRLCAFDKKIAKTDIVKSMRARALCSECRQTLLNRPNPIPPAQLEAVERLFAASGDLLEGKQQARPRAFVGSSSEGLETARTLKYLLKDDLEITIWNDDKVFGLGRITIEDLEKSVLGYDYGIFLFTPDDSLQMRGHTRSVTRDNVLFELGLFMGKLTRQRAIVIQADAVSMPSDLSGLTTARFNHTDTDIAKALQNAVHTIRITLGRHA